MSRTFALLAVLFLAGCVNGEEATGPPVIDCQLFGEWVDRTFRTDSIICIDENGDRHNGIPVIGG